MAHNHLFFGVAFALFLLLVLPFGSSLSLAVPPNGVQVYPGQELESSIVIQNVLEGAQTLVMEGVFEEGASVASFEGDSSTFTIPGGAITEIPVVYSIPDTASVGTTYSVILYFTTVSGGETGGGSVDISQGLRRAYTLTVIERPAEEFPAVTEEASSGSGMVWWVLGIIVLVGIVAIVVMRRKGSSTPADLSVATSMSMNASTAPPSDSTPSGKDSRK